LWKIAAWEGGAAMITIFKSQHQMMDGIHVTGKVEEFSPGSWINVVSPDRTEIDQIANLGIPMDFLTYPLDLDERSRTEREDNGQVLVILRVPWFQGTKADSPYITIPLGLILTDQYFITVCSKETDILQPFMDGRIKGFSTVKRSRFLLHVLLVTANRYLAHLREINKAVDTLEDKLQDSMKNRELLELLKYQKSLVYFTTALKGNEFMLERLQRGQLFRMYPDDEDLLEDVITENQQAIEMVNISGSILSSMMDAFASIISNNLNVVMKFLASMTIVLSIPTIITSFFGMNLDLPFDANPLGIFFVIGLTLFFSLLTISIFNRRNWF
jgi:magnesium transporter